MPAIGTDKAIISYVNWPDKNISDAEINDTFKIIGEAAEGINFPEYCNIEPQIAITDNIGKYMIVARAKLVAVSNTSLFLIKPGAKPIIK